MGNFGKQKGQGSDGNGSSEVDNLGKKLASAKKDKKEQYDYFK